MKKRFFLIDAMAMAFRSHHAFSKRPLYTKAGFPTSSLFGSAQFLLRLMAMEKIDYLMIATDSRERTFRHHLYDAYKANRKAVPEELLAQIPVLFDFFASMGVPLIKTPGCEADDIIASLVEKYAADDVHCYIVSGDKDFCQLVNKNVSLYTPGQKGDFSEIDEIGVFAKFGVKPTQIADYLAICGDSSDNVPGIAGLGEKGAKDLLSKYESLAGIYENLESIPNARHQKCLREGRDMADLSKRLVLLKHDCSLDHELSGFAFKGYENLKKTDVREFFKTYEFFTLLERFEKNTGTSEAPQPRVIDPANSEPGAQLANSESTESIGFFASQMDYRAVQTEEAFSELLAILGDASVFAFDTETTGLHPLKDKPIGISFSTLPGHAFYLPLLERDLKGLSPEMIVSRLQVLFASEEKIKVAHNLKFDSQMLKNIGIELTGPYFDTYVAAGLLLDPLESLSIDALSLKYFGIRKIPTTHLMGKKHEISMVNVPFSDLVLYGSEDADCTLRLYHLLTHELREQNLFSYFERYELPLIPVLANMEREGIQINDAKLKDLSTEFQARIAELELSIKTHAGEDFNVASPKQLAEVLFEKMRLHEKLGLKKLKKTKTGFSTNQAVLESMASEPIVIDILEYRTLAKLDGTYLVALPEKVEDSTARIHTSFHQMGTATGRLSSSGPNLQNIPIRTHLGKKIRAAFIPKKGCKLISADYSQIELRLLAHLSEDSALTEAFLIGGDIHILTAAKVARKDPKDVTKEERSAAKAINYGLVYGMGPRRLAETIHVSIAEAKDFIERYFESFPGVRGYLESSVELARVHGYSQTMGGRRRIITGLDGRDGVMAQAFAKNIALNSPIQGAAADLMKLAMIDIDHRLRAGGFKSRILLQVHDELLLEAPLDEVPMVRDMTRDAMEHAMRLRVPLEVSIGVGDNWLEVHP